MNRAYAALATLVLGSWSLLVPAAVPSTSAGAAHAASASSTQTMSAARATAPTLRIASVTPAVAAPGKPVTITGAVTSGDRSVASPVVTAALGARDLDTTSALASWTSGQSDLLTDVRATARPAALSPGSSTPFTLTLPASALTLGFSNANLPLLLTLADGPGGTALARWRTTISYVKAAPTRPVALTWIVPLTLPADPALFGKSGAPRTAAWTRAIGPGSRIQELLRRLADEPMTWVIDPAVLAPTAAADSNLPAATSGTPSSPAEEPSSTSSTPTGTSTAPSGSPGSTSSPTGTGGTSSSGSPTGTSDPSGPSDSGSSSPTSPSTPGGGTGDPIAALTSALRTRLQSLPKAQSVWWTANDDPDVAGLTRSNAGRRLLREEVGRTLPADLAAISTTSVVTPASGGDSAMLRTLGGTWSAARRPAPVAVLPQEAAGQPDGLTGTSQRSASGTGGVVLYDQSLSQLVGTGTGDPGLRAQSLLARTLAVYEERPAAARSLALLLPRSGGMSPGGLAQIMLTARSASWLAPRAGADAVRASRSADPLTAQTVTPRFPAPGTAAISAPIAASIRTQRIQLAGLNSMLVRSDDVISDRLRLVDNLGSTRWRINHPAGTAATTASGTALQDLLGAVTVSSSSVNLFASRAQIAITVVNKLNRPVRGVRVELAPGSFIFKVRRQADPVEILAGGRAIVRPELAASSKGRTTVTVRVRTANQVTLGPRNDGAVLTVNVRPTATWIYWVLGGVAGVVLVGGVFRSVRRGPRRDEVGSPAPGDPAPATATPGETIVATATTPSGPTDQGGDAPDHTRSADEDRDD